MGEILQPFNSAHFLLLPTDKKLHIFKASCALKVNIFFKNEESVYYEFKKNKSYLKPEHYILEILREKAPSPAGNAWS